MKAKPQKPPGAGRRVRTLIQLVRAATDRRSVIGPFTQNHPSPAAFVANLPGFQLYVALERGLWLYEPAKGRKERPAWREAQKRAQRAWRRQQERSAEALDDDIPF